MVRALHGACWVGSILPLSIRACGHAREERRAGAEAADVVIALQAGEEDLRSPLYIQTVPIFKRPILGCTGADFCNSRLIGELSPRSVKRARDAL